MSRPRQPIPPGLTAGAFTVGQGRAAGLSDERMRGRDLDRPFRGVRIARDASPAEGGFLAGLDLPAPPPELVARCAALAVALDGEPLFSHGTAALLWPVPLPPRVTDDELHIGVRPPQRPPRRRGVRAHRLLDRDVLDVVRHERRIVDPASMFCQLSTMLPVDDLVAVGDALIYAPRHPHPYDDRPWLTPGELAERVATFRGRGKAAASRAVGLLRPGAESRPETLLRLAIIDAGLPEPEVNVEIHAAGGVFLGRGDLVYRRWRLVVEYDGDHHRSSTRQYDKDLLRTDRLTEHGWRVLRFTGRGFFGDRAGCLLRIEHALVSAGWTRP